MLPLLFILTTRHDVPQADVFEMVVVLGVLTEVVMLALICIGSYYLAVRRRLRPGGDSRGALLPARVQDAGDRRLARSAAAVPGGRRRTFVCSCRPWP